MTNLRDHILAWLDSIGADGVMYSREDNTKLAWSLVEIKDFCAGIDVTLVPAYRHADGSYHTEPEEIKNPCNGCIYDSIDGDDCEENNGFCDEYIRYKHWLSHKEATK